MKKSLKRRMRLDCLRYMRYVTLARFLVDAFALCMPTLNAYLIGDMTDRLLAMDRAGVLQGLPRFGLALAATAFAVPLLTMWEYFQMTRHGFLYDRFLLETFFRQPLRAIQRQDYGTVIEHIEGDLGDFCWNTVFVFSLPAALGVYAAWVAGLFALEGIPLGFALALLAAPALPLLKASAFGNPKAEARKKQAEWNEKRRGVEARAFSAGDFLRNNGLFDWTGKKLDGLYEEYMARDGKRNLALRGKDQALDFFLQYGGAIAVLLMGGWYAARGDITVGVLLSGYMILSPIQKFYTLAGQWVEERKGANAYFERVSLFYGAEEREEAPAAPGAPAAICLRDVSFAYAEGAKNVLAHLSAAVPADGRTWIVGPNGSGKSTLLYLISGLYAPSAGWIGGPDGEPLSPVELRGCVSFQEQDGAVFSGTVRENLFLASEEWVEEAEALRRAMGLKKPLDGSVEPGGSNLSPGERKKILLMRMMLKPAAFSILDEPLNHLDRQGREVLADWAREKKGLVIVSHQAFLAPEEGDREIVLP